MYWISANKLRLLPTQKLRRLRNVFRPVLLTFCLGTDKSPKLSCEILHQSEAPARSMHSDSIIVVSFSYVVARVQGKWMYTCHVFLTTITPRQIRENDTAVASCQRREVRGRRLVTTSTSTIRYDELIFVCTQKLTYSQLNLPHWTKKNKKSNEEN